MKVLLIMLLLMVIAVLAIFLVYTNTFGLRCMIQGHVLQTEPGEESTCLQKGSSEFSYCIACNTVVQPRTELPLKEHSSQVLPGKEATCTESGISDGSICTVCQTVLVAPETINRLGHDYGEWQVYKKNTCTDYGVNVKTCKRCSIKTYENVDPIGHDLVFKKSDDGNCNVPPADFYECNNCGDTIRELKGSAKGHEFGAYVYNNDGSCTENGTETASCTKCGYTHTRTSYKSNGHTLVSHAAKKPTCQEDGHEAYQTCANCNYTTFKSIPKREHSYSYTAKGSTLVYTCAVCKDSYSEDIKPLTATMNLTGKSTVISTAGSYYATTFSISASGGVGNYTYYYEVFNSASDTAPEFTKGPDGEHSISIKSNVPLSSQVIAFTVTDEVGNSKSFTYYISTGETY